MEENKQRVFNSLFIQRRRMNLSQKHVARMIGQRDTTLLSRYESGRMMPSLETAFRLSILYQTPLTRLFPELHSRIVTEIVDHPRSKTVLRRRFYLDVVVEAA